MVNKPKRQSFAVGPESLPQTWDDNESTKAPSPAPKQADDPLSSIPVAPGAQAWKQKGRGPAKRERAWERKNRSRSYLVPRPLEEKATHIRGTILAMSEELATTVDELARVLVEFALDKLDKGEIKIEGRPNPHSRMMRLSWEDTAEEEKRLPAPKSSKKKKVLEPRRKLFLSYRWPVELDTSIRQVAPEIAAGEVLLYLLDFSLRSYESGYLKIHQEPIVSYRLGGSWE